MILILGGTHEGREVAEALSKANIQYFLTVTTSLGKKTYSDLQCEVHVCKFDVLSLVDFIQQHAIQLVIDTTHPHALEIKKVANSACEKCNIPCWRYSRQLDINFKQITNDVSYFESMEELVFALKKETTIGNLFITGTKHIGLFYQHFSKSNCYFRVMPSLFSIEQCEKWEVPLSHIIGIKAPCSVALNQALFSAYEITHFIFKASGAGSGFNNNLDSLKGTHIRGFVLKSPQIEPSDFEYFYHDVEALCLAIKNFNNEEVKK